MFTPLMPDKIKLEKTLSEQLKDVTWLGLSKKGTSLEIDVVQKSLPKKEKVLSPSNLIASKKGMIKSIFTKKGQAVVKKYQWVNKGDILVSGKIGTEEKPVWIAAEGKVMAETWYHSNITIPIKRTVMTIKGPVSKEHQLVLFNYLIHLWGKIPADKTSHAACHKTAHTYYFLGFALPFKTNVIQCSTEKKTMIELSKQDALEMAKRVSDQRLLSQTPPKSTIILRKLEKVDQTDSTRLFTFRYVVEENIAVRDSLGNIPPASPPKK
jgi:similar to stage IV sporulation protein